MIIRGANHVDLYDKVDVIPFGKIADFFDQHLAAYRSAERLRDRGNTWSVKKNSGREGRSS